MVTITHTNQTQEQELEQELEQEQEQEQEHGTLTVSGPTIDETIQRAVKIFGPLGLSQADAITLYIGLQVRAQDILALMLFNRLDPQNPTALDTAARVLLEHARELLTHAPVLLTREMLDKMLDDIQADKRQEARARNKGKYQ